MDSRRRTDYAHGGRLHVRYVVLPLRLDADCIYIDSCLE